MGPNISSMNELRSSRLEGSEMVAGSVESNAAVHSIKNHAASQRERCLGPGQLKGCLWEQPGGDYILCAHNTLDPRLLFMARAAESQTETYFFLFSGNSFWDLS